MGCIMLHHFDAGKDIRWTPSGFSVYSSGWRLCRRVANGYHFHEQTEEGAPGFTACFISHRAIIVQAAIC